MPVFFQHQINEFTRIGVWKIEEPESFFRGNVPVSRQVTHPHKRLQHLAGRFLLQFLFPDFPFELIQIADTRKPFVLDERYHFSISHCGDYAAAIVSSRQRVGVDIEMPVEKLQRIQHKFLSPEEMFRFPNLQDADNYTQLTHLWSAKEAVFKWYGLGKVDFREHMPMYPGNTHEELICSFVLTQQKLKVVTKDLGKLVLSYTVS